MTGSSTRVIKKLDPKELEKVKLAIDIKKKAKKNGDKQPKHNN